jgi:hypothetical protein
MSLVTRYVIAVKRHLPQPLQQDVGDELESLLQDRIEAEAERLSREPTEAEIAALLHRHGHPYRVATSYLPQTGLVDPQAYALYKRTLARVTATWLLITVVVGLYTFYGAEGGFDWSALPAFWHGAFDVLAALIIGLTAVFHAMGAAFVISGVGWRWDPSQLPTNDATWLPQSMPTAVAGVVLAMTYLGLVLGAQQAAEGAMLGPGIGPLLPIFHVLALVFLLLGLIALFQRYATRVRLYVWSATATALALLLAWVVATQRILVLSAADAGERSAIFVAWWPEIVLKGLLALVAVALMRATLRALRRARIASLPLF